MALPLPSPYPKRRYSDKQSYCNSRSRCENHCVANCVEGSDRDVTSSKVTVYLHQADVKVTSGSCRPGAVGQAAPKRPFLQVTCPPRSSI
jgi:hypothetical protein